MTHYLADLFTTTMEAAKKASIADQCTVHVFVTLSTMPEPGAPYGLPIITGFGLSDWHDGATIASWTKGERN